MRLLAFSDLHRDVAAARGIVERSRTVDVVVGAGDYATVRKGLQAVIEVLRAIEVPCVLVPGNSESDEELRQACAGWESAHVLHGGSVFIDAVPFFGLGAAVPVTPFGDWSFDLSEEEAARYLARCPDHSVLVTHSPPLGHVDQDSRGRSLGSRAVVDAVERTRPSLVVCGHIHHSWGKRSTANGTLVLNAGPEGIVLDVP